jgi:hypothetical protein
MTGKTPNNKAPVARFQKYDETMTMQIKNTLTRFSLLLVIVCSAAAIGAPPQDLGTQLRSYDPSVQFGGGTGQRNIVLDFQAVQSPVISWAWGAARAESGPGTAAFFQEISITRPIDELSATLLRLVADGSQVMGATLTDGDVSIQMQVVGITSYSVGGAGTALSENITLSFQSFTYSAAGAEVCWDIQNNVQC